MILAIDPSGNFNEGKGITGWTLLSEDNGAIVKFGAIDASTCLTAEEHWTNHINLIKGITEEYDSVYVVIEDFILYASKASSQINSRFETVKLIGIIQLYCWTEKIPLHFQTAVSVKRRWKNFLLEKKGFIEIKKYNKGKKTYEMCYINGYKVNDHVIDSLRHGVHFYYFQTKKEDTND